MRKYIEILCITLAIQFGLFLVAYNLYNLPIASDMLKDISLLIWIIGVPISIIADIVLAIRWGATIKKKLIYIFLMPTNYTWVIYILWALWFVNKIIDILMGGPYNWG